MKLRKFFSFIMLAVMLIAAVSCGDDDINYNHLRKRTWHAVINWADGSKGDVYYYFYKGNDGDWGAFHYVIISLER